MRAFVLLFVLSNFAVAQHDSHDHAAHEKMEKRGTEAMGFDQQTTAHHFLLNRTGGIIDVSVKNAKDIDGLRAIRAHLTMISEAFQSGEFNVPGFIHDQTPSGSKTMAELKDEIEYKFAETDLGGQVTITTKNKQALRAVHDFLRFQITEHRTGDPLQPPSTTK